ncbi:MAG TPA: hypothetical protein VF510_00245, partial [Ktedonobacterales bacterium]
MTIPLLAINENSLAQRCGQGIAKREESVGLGSLRERLVDMWVRPWRHANFRWVFLTRAFVLCFLAAAAISAPPAASSLEPGETGHFSREFAAGVGYVLNHTVLR